MILLKIVSISIFCWGISSATNTSAVGASCTISDFSQVSHVTSSCNNIIVSNLKVPARKTLSLQLKKGSSLTFTGTTTFGVAHWDGTLMEIKGEDLKVRGERGHKIDGDGAQYWDGKGGKGKPVLMRAHGSGQFTNLNVVNCPERCTIFEGSHITVDGLNVDVSAGDNRGGHNTDGIGLSGSDITVRNAVVKNQDDCVVIGSGKNIHVSNVHCYGSHGLSLSVGGHSVSNVTFTQCSLTNADNGIHIKTHKDSGNGVIQDITYSHITLSGIKRYGAYIQQDYPEDDKIPKGNVPIKGLTIVDVKGTMNGKDSIPIQVVCASGACSNWKFSDIKITGNGKPCYMNYHPAGFSC